MSTQSAKASSTTGAVELIEQLMRAAGERQPVRAKSLIVSLMGDAVAHHAQQIWLGELIDALAPLGINERLVRTAVYRLVQDDWLVADREGRRSRYRFSRAGLARFENAARRVYRVDTPEWNGQWTIVSPVLLKDKERESLRRELSWLGYGQIATGLMGHPNASRSVLDSVLDTLGFRGRVLVLTASAEDPESDSILKTVAQEAWETRELSDQYQQFLHRYMPLLEAVNAQPVAAHHAFYLRLLAVHDYRRILLKDRDLPPELLPQSWPGSQAADLLMSIYEATGQAAERHIRRALSAGQKARESSSAFLRRFGGLPHSFAPET